jgi:hypothetical protein
MNRSQILRIFIVVQNAKSLVSSSKLINAKMRIAYLPIYNGLLLNELRNLSGLYREGKGLLACVFPKLKIKCFYVCLAHLKAVSKASCQSVKRLYCLYKLRRF